MKPAQVVKELVKWLPVAWELRELFGGDKRKALRAIRSRELKLRAARDRRMGRG